MSHIWELKDVDTSGAIQEAEAAVAGDTRADFFKKAAIGGGSVLAAGSVMGILAEQSWAAPSRRQDTAILNYALTLEYLEDAFYTQ
nr:ferritin-like domain-containing protein [Thermoleophilaceae bacterium]